MARPPTSTTPSAADGEERAYEARAAASPDERDPLTDPGIPTPELPLAEARSFEGYISAMPIEPQTAPVSTRGPIGWARANLFNGPGNAILTLVFGALTIYTLYGLFNFAIFDATWTGAD